MKRLSYFRAITQIQGNCIDAIKTIAPKVDTETANKGFLMMIKIAGGAALGTVATGAIYAIGSITNQRYKLKTDRLRALRGI